MINIIIPVYNHALYTYRTIESLLKETNSPVRIIMIDDGSTDDTIDYAIELRDRLGDGFWYARNEKNMGVHYSWNVGLRVAFSQPAEYIAIINNDLLFTKDWDIPLIKALETKKLVSPYHTTGEVPADWPIGSQRMPNEVLIEILGACFMAKTETFREVGFFPEQMRYYYGDNWIVEKVKPENCAQIQESYVHHYCGKTTNQLGVAEWLQKDHEEYEKL